MLRLRRRERPEVVLAEQEVRARGERLVVERPREPPAAPRLERRRASRAARCGSGSSAPGPSGARGSPGGRLGGDHGHVVGKLGVQRLGGALAGGPPSTSTLTTWPSACTPVSVRPPPRAARRLVDPAERARSTPSTVRSAGWAAQPRKRFRRTPASASAAQRISSPRDQRRVARRDRPRRRAARLQPRRAPARARPRRRGPQAARAPRDRHAGTARASSSTRGTEVQAREASGRARSSSTPTSSTALASTRWDADDRRVDLPHRESAEAVDDEPLAEEDYRLAAHLSSSTSRGHASAVEDRLRYEGRCPSTAAGATSRSTRGPRTTRTSSPTAFATACPRRESWVEANPEGIPSPAFV